MTSPLYSSVNGTRFTSSPEEGKKTQDSALPEVPQELPLVLPSCSATALHWMRLTNLTKHYTSNILTRCFRLCCCIKKFIFVKKKKIYSAAHLYSMSPSRATKRTLKGIVHFEINFSLPQRHPRCRCLCFHSIFDFDFFRSNRSCLSVI